MTPFQIERLQALMAAVVVRRRKRSSLEEETKQLELRKKANSEALIQAERDLESYQDEILRTLVARAV